MRIAVLGATSQIARDLIQSLGRLDAHELFLYARRPDTVLEWLAQLGTPQRHSVEAFGAFVNTQFYDAILNCVGVGNPAQAMAMGASIFDVTAQYDEMALQYIRKHPTCRYIFLSSGAVYGSKFALPADVGTQATVAVNHFQPQHWYGVAKLHAECRHRSLPHLHIVDIRVFNYFSSSQDLSASFLICDLLRAIQTNTVFLTSPENLVRDYLGPEDLFSLVTCILKNPPTNAAFDCYTRAPVDKLTLLMTMEALFGLVYQFSDTAHMTRATGNKLNYYSKNHGAKAIGYSPSKTAIETVIYQSKLVLFETSTGLP